MGKRYLICIVFVALAILLMGCLNLAENNAEAEIEQELPVGVHQSNNGDYYYTIKLPTGAEVEDYFTLTGPKNTIHVAETDVDSYSEDMGFVYYYTCTKGGWVAFSGKNPDRVMYIPEGLSAQQVQIICATFPYRAAKCMSMDEAKNYISWLQD